MGSLLAARIAEALEYVPAHDRDVWLRMGMATKSECGDGGFSIWDGWSQSAENYNRQESVRAWQSIKPNGKITVATLFYEAKRNGWPDDGCRRSPVLSQEAFSNARCSSEMEAKAEAERTAFMAARILDAAEPASPDHSYLVRKRLRPCPALREIDASRAISLLGYVPQSSGKPLVGRLLVVPLQRGDELATVELIDGQGRKAALKGRGSKAGAWWVSESLHAESEEQPILLIGEGVATVLSAAQSTAHIGVAALSNSNLPAVTRAMRERYPSAGIVILADLQKASGEPDRYAVEAAKQSGAKLAVPNFGPNREPHRKDFNDMAIANGHASVAKCIAAAQPIKLDVKSDKDDQAAVELVCAADVEPEAIRWLWPGFLAEGKLSILAGAPGTGKTTIALSLAAIVSSGGMWPDGGRAQLGDVIIWSGEDGTSDVLVPRLLACGADLSRVHFVGPVKQAQGKRDFDPARDVELLKGALLAFPNVKFLIIDPIVSAVAGDSHKNAEVRRALQPLVSLAASKGCCAFGITHFSKSTAGRDPLERLTGSLAFGALARCVMVTVKQQQAEGEEPKPRMLVRAKSNLGEDGGGFEYHLEAIDLPTNSEIKATQVRWGEAVKGSAHALLASVEGDAAKRATALSEAEDFLKDSLSNGPRACAELQEEAEAAGIKPATLRRAKQRLSIVVEKTGMQSGWAWALPGRRSDGAEDDHQKA